MLVFALLGKRRSYKNAQREGKCGQHCKLVRPLEDPGSNADILYLAQSHRSHPFIILRAEFEQNCHSARWIEQHARPQSRWGMEGWVLRWMASSVLRLMCVGGVVPVDIRPF